MRKLMIEILLVAAGAVVIIYATIFADISRTAEIWLSYLGVMIAAAAPCLFLQQKHWDQQKEKRTKNILTAGDRTTPPYPNEVKPPATSGLLFLGNYVAYTDKFPFHVLSLDDQPVMTLDRKEGVLLLSAVFFDDDGKSICEVRQNRIFAGSASGFRIEHETYGPTRLRVIDSRSRTILDVEYINARTMRMTGDFYMSNGVRLVIDGERILFETPRYIFGTVRSAGMEGDGERPAIKFALQDAKGLVPHVEIQNWRAMSERMILSQDKYTARPNVLDSPRYIPRVADDPEEGEVLAPGDGPMPMRRYPKPSSEELAMMPESVRKDVEAKAGQPIDENLPPNVVRLYLGSLLTWAYKYPFTVISQGTEDLMVINRDNYGDVWLNAKFFDETGKIMCEIVNNRFRRNPGNTWAFRQTPISIAVLNEESRPVVNVEYINPEAIRITGDFYLRDGFHVILDNDRETQQFGQGELGGTLFPIGGERPIAIAIEPPEDLGRAVFVEVVRVKETPDEAPKEQD
jgi:hypothetical protein